MLVNLHTHTVFCDGRSTPEQIVLAALYRGFSAIGFSGHGHTEYDQRFCVLDVENYIREVLRLKEKYRGRIEIYLGAEEDSHGVVSRREDYDYIIGSCHYIGHEGKLYPLDSGYDYFCKALSLFDGDPLRLADSYYRHFCSYILTYRPDIIGHFDVVAKFEETKRSILLENEGYWRLAEHYTKEALRANVLFEVNTGLIARGYRTSPCPHERLLHVIRREGGSVILSSDSHSVDTLGFGFKEARALLRDVGFDHVMVLSEGKWKSVSLDEIDV